MFSPIAAPELPGARRYRAPILLVALLLCLGDCRAAQDWWVLSTWPQEPELAADEPENFADAKSQLQWKWQYGHWLASDSDDEQDSFDSHGNRWTALYHWDRAPLSLFAEVDDTQHHIRQQTEHDLRLIDRRKHQDITLSFQPDWGGLAAFRHQGRLGFSAAFNLWSNLRLFLKQTARNSRQQIAMRLAIPELPHTGAATADSDYVLDFEFPVDCQLRFWGLLGVQKRFSLWYQQGRSPDGDCKQDQGYWRSELGPHWRLSGGYRHQTFQSAGASLSIDQLPVGATASHSHLTRAELGLAYQTGAHRWKLYALDGNADFHFIGGFPSGSLGSVSWFLATARGAAFVRGDIAFRSWGVEYAYHQPQGWQTRLSIGRVTLDTHIPYGYDVSDPVGVLGLGRGSLAKDAGQFRYDSIDAAQLALGVGYARGQWQIQYTMTQYIPIALRSDADADAGAGDAGHSLGGYQWQGLPDGNYQSLVLRYFF